MQYFKTVEEIKGMSMQEAIALTKKREALEIGYNDHDCGTPTGDGCPVCVEYQIMKDEEAQLIKTGQLEE
jgi:hypothetical protein